MKYEWFGHLGGWGKRFSRMGILPEIFDGRGVPGGSPGMPREGGK